MNGEDGSRNAFNPDHYAALPKAYLPKNIIFHIVQIEDITKSKVTQLEDWKTIENPFSASVDRVKQSAQAHAIQRSIIANNGVDDGDFQVAPQEQPNDNFFAYQNTIYKLTLQDIVGNKCYAVEISKLPFLHSRNSSKALGYLPIPLGGKLIVNQGTLIKRGVLFLQPNSVKYIGGEIPELNTNNVTSSISWLTEEVNKIKNKRV